MSYSTRWILSLRVPRIVISSLAVLGLGAPAWWLVVVRPARERAETEIRQSISLARAALQAGQPARALQVVATIPESGPWAADLLTIEGMAFAALERPEEARPRLERSLDADPKQPMAAKVLAAVYFSDNDMDRGLAMLARAASIDPDDFRPWFAAGDVLLRYCNRPLEAVDVFRQAIRRRPEDRGSRVGLASALLALGETQEAAPLVEALLNESPGDPTILRHAATLARLGSRHEDVERYTEKVLLQDPDNIEALLIRGQSRFESGRPKEALVDAERAVALAPDNLSALHLLAGIENAVGFKDRSAATAQRHRKALALAGRIEQLRVEVRKRPSDLNLHCRLGEAAAQGSMMALARKSFRAALALDQNCKPAREGLASLDGLPYPP